MTSDNTNLDALRREIDEIDLRLLRAIAERTAVVRKVAAAKGGGPVLRPGREAGVIRRLLSGAETGLPAPVVGRIWRELIAAYCRLQGPLEVAVCAPEKSVGYWDLARDHFGSGTRMTLHKSPAVTLRAVSETEGTVAILPLPQDGESDPWWRSMTGREGEPRVIGRLPFVDNPGARFEDLHAMVVGRVSFDPSGDDISWLVISTTVEISRRSIGDHLKALGLSGAALASHNERGAGDLHLFEVDGLIAADEPKLAEFAKRVGGNAHVVVAGAFARPFARG